MVNNERRSFKGVSRPTEELHNSSPEKIQPWMQITGGIPPKKKQSGGCSVRDSTHGIAEGSLLVMGNAPDGLRKEQF
jgi:hypothetical protein